MVNARSVIVIQIINIIFINCSWKINKIKMHLNLKQTFTEEKQFDGINNG